MWYRDPYYSRRSGFSGLFGSSSAVQTLILANIAVFILQLLARTSPALRGIDHLFALVPNKFWGQLHLWQAFTYMFLHGGLGHIFWNMFALWMFGPHLERAWGSREFIKYYFITGIGAGIIYAIFRFNSPIPMLGASGAVYGILLAFGVLYPDAIIFFGFIFPIRAKYAVLILGFLAFIFSVRGEVDGIAHSAHLAGMAVGLVYLRRDRLFGGFSSRIKSIHREREERGRYRRAEERAQLKAEVDQILAKISRYGEESLTDEERRTLERASREYGQDL
jgi:membrane associated rhomboid family serine protease